MSLFAVIVLLFNNTNPMSHEFSMSTKVKWTISILLFGIAISCLALPRLIGSVIGDVISDQIFEQISSSTNGQIVIFDPQIEAGWFRSIIRVSVEISDGRQLIEPYYLSLQGNINHGPILPAHSSLSLGLASVDLVVDTDKLQSKFADIVMDTLTASFLVRFDQSISLDLKIPAIDVHNIDNTLAVVIDGLDVQLEIQEDLSALAYINADRVSIYNNQSDLELTLVQPSLNATTDTFGQTSAASGVSATIPLVDASDPLSFNVSNLNFEWRSEPSSIGPGLTDISQDIQVSNIESELPLESISWESEIEGIKQELITSYNKMLLGMQSSSGVDPISKISELTRLGNETGLLLLQNEVRLNNILEVDLYKGVHKLELNVFWKGLPKAQGIDDFKLENGLNAMDVEVDLRLNQESVSFSPFAELAELYTSQGYLLSSGKDLIFQAKLKEGNASINNEDFPLQQILQ
tara:strand:+ start:1067 stop:2458 length:1392 start_codon:yes stop_codon:yes gene_type:complete